MILFPNAKINIGLRVLRKRPDGYHDIDSIFVPLPWCDILEIVPAKGSRTTLSIIGKDILQLDNPDDNLISKALKALENRLGEKLPPLDIYLSKCIPTGAGLGGGSADASFALRGVNELLNLGLEPDELASIAKNVGADCPFFVYNRPMHVESIGDVMTPIEIPSLDALWVMAAKIPGTEVSTRQAYAGVHRAELLPGECLTNDIAKEPTAWQRTSLTNDFEPSVFALQPMVKSLKDHMQQITGTLYCSMSGSGSTVYGLYDNANDAAMAADNIKSLYDNADIFTGKLTSKPIV